MLASTHPRIAAPGCCGQRNLAQGPPSDSLPPKQQRERRGRGAAEGTRSLSVRTGALDPIPGGPLLPQVPLRLE